MRSLLAIALALCCLLAASVCAVQSPRERLSKSWSSPSHDFIKSYVDRPYNQRQDIALLEQKAGSRDDALLKADAMLDELGLNEDQAQGKEGEGVFNAEGTLQSEWPPKFEANPPVQPADTSDVISTNDVLNAKSGGSSLMGQVEGRLEQKVPTPPKTDGNVDANQAAGMAAKSFLSKQKQKASLLETKAHLFHHIQHNLTRTKYDTSLLIEENAWLSEEEKGILSFLSPELTILGLSIGYGKATFGVEVVYDVATYQIAGFAYFGLSNDIMSIKKMIGGNLKTPGGFVKDFIKDIWSSFFSPQSDLSLTAYIAWGWKGNTIDTCLPRAYEQWFIGVDLNAPLVQKLIGIPPPLSVPILGAMSSSGPPTSAGDILSIFTNDMFAVKTLGVGLRINKGMSNVLPLTIGLGWSYYWRLGARSYKTPAEFMRGINPVGDFGSILFGTTHKPVDDMSVSSLSYVVFKTAQVILQLLVGVTLVINEWDGTPYPPGQQKCVDSATGALEDPTKYNGIMSIWQLIGGGISDIFTNERQARLKTNQVAWRKGLLGPNMHGVYTSPHSSKPIYLTLKPQQEGEEPLWFWSWSQDKASGDWCGVNQHTCGAGGRPAQAELDVLLTLDLDNQILKMKKQLAAKMEQALLDAQNVATDQKLNKACGTQGTCMIRAPEPTSSAGIALTTLSKWIGRTCSAWKDGLCGNGPAGLSCCTDADDTYLLENQPCHGYRGLCRVKTTGNECPAPHKWQSGLCGRGNAVCCEGMTANDLKPEDVRKREANDVNFVDAMDDKVASCQARILGMTLLRSTSSADLVWQLTVRATPRASKSYELRYTGDGVTEGWEWRSGPSGQFQKVSQTGNESPAAKAVFAKLAAAQAFARGDCGSFSKHDCVAQALMMTGPVNGFYSIPQHFDRATSKSVSALYFRHMPDRGWEWSKTKVLWTSVEKQSAADGFTPESSNRIIISYLERVDPGPGSDALEAADARQENGLFLKILDCTDLPEEYSMWGEWRPYWRCEVTSKDLKANTAVGKKLSAGAWSWKDVSPVDPKGFKWIQSGQEASCQLHGAWKVLSDKPYAQKFVVSPQVWQSLPAGANGAKKIKLLNGKGECSIMFHYHWSA